MALFALLGCTQILPTGRPPAPQPPAAEQAVLAGEARFPEALVESGQVLPTGIGSVIQAGERRFRIQHAGEAHELPVVGATVVLRDPATRRRLVGNAPTETDAQGRFSFARAPAGVNHLIEVTFLAQDGAKAYRLLAMARAGAAGSGVAVGWRSTMAVAAWLESPGADPRHAPLDALEAQEAAANAAFEALAPEARQAFLAGLLTAPPAALGPDGTPAEALPMPAVTPLPGVATPTPGVSLSPSPLASTIEATLATPRPSASATSTPDTTLVEETVDTVEDTLSPKPLPTTDLL